ncbi:putative methyltransferase [Aspergillus steynii IBT 23096]|uniref:Putative methyltransferase n=1 Tax=Aspergillus steynii IBT 23096 TaxID=1392250 RepID=A0A2I2GK56_9EURO|nr:putative methyltransferase [Aspergillus steynii IBT 23096]PLB53237.1 putative methyltransferase [Aspergillus steynii IBT 23096]
MTSTTTTAKTTPPIPSGPTTTSLIFYSPPSDSSPPFNYVEAPPPGLPQRNYNEETHRVPLTDIRAHDLSQYSLSTSAFSVLQSIPTLTTRETFNSDPLVKAHYYPEVTSLLKDYLSAADGTSPENIEVILFDHTIRLSSPDAPRAPVHRAHVDQTRFAASERVKLHVTDPALREAALSGSLRYRIINVWRPLNGPVESNPLAFAHAQSIDPETDLVAVQHRYPHRVGETMGVKYREGQRWMYLSGMTGEERLLLQCSDSWAGKDGRSERVVVPHSAFWDEKTPEGARGRESIEVRALVLG